MEIKIRRKKEVVFDKRFEVGDNSELCHHTGFEVVFKGDEDTAQNTWNEYVDSKGGYHYGR